MSVTNATQIKKSRDLIDGFRKNINLLRSKGISEQVLDRMTQAVNSLAEADHECDEIRAEYKKKSTKTREILTEVKQTFVEKKKLVKLNYPQDEWIKFGIVDKR